MRYLELPDVPAWSKIGLGTWQFGSREWGYGEDYVGRAAELVQRALDLGVTFFDTAEIYGFGRSETILGAALKDRRAEAVIATKIFPVLPTAAIVEQRGVASARRLGVTRLDLYQVHQPNPVVSDKTTMRGMRALQDVGLVDHVGVSNYSLERWKAAQRALGRRVLSNQVQYSLAARGPQAELLPWAAANDRVLIAWSPLAQGLLSGRYDVDHRPSGAVRAGNPLFLEENLRRAAPLIQTLRQVADAHDASPAQVALAALIRHPNVVAIPGASSVQQLESNVAAAELELTDDEAAALDDAAQAFDPVTGRKAGVGLVKARLGRG